MEQQIQQIQWTGNNQKQLSRSYMRLSDFVQTPQRKKYKENNEKSWQQ